MGEEEKKGLRLVSSMFRVGFSSSQIELTINRASGSQRLRDSSCLACLAAYLPSRRLIMKLGCNLNYAHADGGLA